MAKLNKKSRAIAKALRARRSTMEALMATPRLASDYANSKVDLVFTNGQGRTFVGRQTQHGNITSAYRAADRATAAKVRDGTAPTGRWQAPRKRFEK